MKRGIITNNGQGIHISDGEIWMTTWELADLYYTTTGAIFHVVSPMCSCVWSALV